MKPGEPSPTPFSPFRRVAGALAVLLWGTAGTAATGNLSAMEVERLNAAEPIITSAMLREAGVDGIAFRRGDLVIGEADNINGPSAIEVPDWLAERFAGTPVEGARYLLYFAHHRGSWVRLAYARSIEGPWSLYNPKGSEHPLGLRGVLELAETVDGPPLKKTLGLGPGLSLVRETASPDVHLDAERQRVVMYFHAGSSLGQKTFAATSSDGLNFNLPGFGGQPGHGVRPVALGPFYFRVFAHRGRAYAFTNGAFLYRAPEGAGPADDAAFSPPAGFDRSRQVLWEEIPSPLHAHFRAHGLEPRLPRHFAVHRRGDSLEVFFSMKQAKPERIVRVIMDIGADDPRDWTIRPPDDGAAFEDVLVPEYAWEGADLALGRSSGGVGDAEGERSLRDPALLQTADGDNYLFYAGGGEKAIGVARIQFSEDREREE